MVRLLRTRDGIIRGLQTHGNGSGVHDRASRQIVLHVICGAWKGGSGGNGGMRGCKSGGHGVLGSEVLRMWWLLEGHHVRTWVSRQCGTVCRGGG